MTRRNLAALATVAAAAPAQPTPPPAREDLKANAQAQLRRTAEALDKFPLPMAQEPAFRFKA